MIRPPAGGGGVVSVRQSTGAIAAVSTVDVTVTWPVAFTSTAYTVVVSLEEGSAGTALRTRKIVSRTVSTVVVRVSNDDATVVHTGTLHAVAIAG